MQSGYPAAALLAFYLIHDRIVGGKAAERVFFHLDTYKSYPGIRRGRELSFGFRRNSQPVALGESHFLAVNNGFALAGNNAVYLFVALVRMDERNACARRKSARRLLLQRRLLKRNLRHTGNLSVLLIIVLHKWKKNTLLSIGGGTALYMLLVQTVFK